MGEPPPIVIEGLGYSFGEGELRTGVLFDVSARVEAGEIVIVTGPSGSGKTTLLTLIGALRSVEEGSIRVLGEELCGAGPRLLEKVRRRIGYVFQAHNLLDSLEAWRNVQLASLLERGSSLAEARRKAIETLERVGLGDRVDHYPSELSGGQRQRVAIARALAGGPRIILADEPTASLDARTGREVVELMRTLAKKDGVTVVLVTHDSRVLDAADRILHLEDGRLVTFTEAVTSHTRHMMGLLAQTTRRGELGRRIAEMPEAGFLEFLEQVTHESRTFLEVSQLSRDEAFESMLDQALQAFTLKMADLLRCERASLFLVDEGRGELWLKVAKEEGGRPVDFRMPLAKGIAGRVATSGRSMRVDDAYTHPLFNPAADRATGFRTRSILCVPICDAGGRTFAVAQLLNRCDGQPFDREDEAHFAMLVESIGVLLQTWWEMSTDTLGALSQGSLVAGTNKPRSRLALR